ncbi:MAG TPA: hypothetical protein VF498_18390 [Anaerolineales bacterium]
MILQNSDGDATPTPTLAARSTALPGNVLIKNCTYTSEYWQAHADIWLAQNVVIGQYSYAKPDALAILRDASPDLATSILKQFITAVLNTLHGADAAAVQPILNDASEWLTANLSQPVISDADQSNGLSLAQNLEGYNKGVFGPGLCPDQPLLPTSTPSLTPTVTPTPTTPYIPPPVSTTPSATAPGRPGGSGGNPPAPTATPTNPPAPPQPTLAPTSTPVPPPTEPPPIAPPTPTQAPPPTNTPEPAKEHKPTHTPRPTPTSPPQILSTNTPKPTKEDRKSAQTPKLLTGFETLWIPFDLFSAL